MKVKGIFLTIAVCLLFRVEAAQRSLSWIYDTAPDGTPCGGGNLIKIDMNKCTSKKTQCEAKKSGTAFGLDTIFTIVKLTSTAWTGRRKCIQFTDTDNSKYALKVVNDRKIIFEVS
ncbi:hypothetical protein OS493_002156 [Desmophyllum pertusum]|uniref:Secreted protein n=1 Tax=Desmophyllum pertusum TaxID=174260 RepID=A0A9W9Z6M3_9CNID|nr:hypothetical protein OS493_002156 [Desmophyllum pertusum]